MCLTSRNLHFILVVIPTRPAPALLLCPGFIHSFFLLFFLFQFVVGTCGPGDTK